MEKIWAGMENILRWILENILKIHVRDEALKGLIQFVQFGLVGVSNTAVSYLSYLLFVLLGLHYMPANFLAFVISVLNSFYWNNKYVFADRNHKRKWLPVLVRTFIAYGFTGLIMNSVLLYFEVEVFHISEMVAPLINLIFTIPLNFVINKFWAYKSTVEGK